MSIRDDGFEISFMPYELVVMSTHLDALHYHQGTTNPIESIKQVVSSIQSTVNQYIGPNGHIAKRCGSVRRSLGLSDVNHCYRPYGNGDHIIDCANNTEASIGLGFGGGDFTLFIRSPNFYWSSRIRADIQSIIGVRDTYNLPCHRVFLRSSQPDTDNQPACSLKNKPSHPVRVSFIVRLNYDHRDTNGFCQTRMPPISGSSLIAVLTELFNVPLFQNEDNHLLTFLTFDNHRLLIQGDFRSWREAIDFQETIRNVPGINAIRSRPWLPIETVTEIDRWKDDADRETPSILCKLLFSISGDKRTMQQTAARIRDDLSEFNLVAPVQRSNRIQMQAGFWSLVIDASTPSLQKLMYCIVHRIIKEKAVSAIRTIPCGGEELFPDMADDSNPDPGQAGRINRYEKPEIRDLDALDEWATTGSSSIYNLNELVYQLYTRKYESEWVAHNVKQTAMEWSTRFQLPRTLFFERFIRGIREGCNESARILASPNAILKPERPLESLEDLALQANAVQSIYSEHIEGLHIASLASPDIRVGTRFGILPLMLSAIDRLMTQYMGYLDTQKHQINHLEFPPTWYGISSTYTGHDVSINTGTLFLRLPVYVRLVPGDVLPLVAHEAGHVHFDHLFPKNMQEFLHTRPPESVIMRLHPVRMKFCRIYWQYIDYLNETMEMIGPTLKKQIGPTLKKQIEERKTRNLGDIYKELFVDILAGLIGSPGYFCCLGRTRFTPYPWINRGNRSRKLIRSQMISVVRRVELGMHMTEHLRLAVPWKRGLRRFHDSLTDNLQSFMNGNPEFRNRIDDTSRLEEKIDEALIAGAYAAMEDGHILEKLCSFFKRNYMVNPLYFDGWLPDLPELSVRAYENCRNIADAIVKTDGFVTHYDPREIVATLELLEPDEPYNRFFRRPTFPTGGVWMSMMYANTTDAERKTMQYRLVFGR
ncbi:hypothetical protein JXA80_14005 [bacterium]|nr:hypothetical protein [candidate division CSSED10-310 bacterium]